MKAMVLHTVGQPLRLEVRPDPVPGAGELRIRVEACAICRTDLHIVDGELSHAELPLVPGHEIVGIADALGPNVDAARLGKRVGLPWLGHACGTCRYCSMGRENLCDDASFTGYSRDGGFATHVIADADYCFDLEGDDAVSLAPLLCAGLIGWRSLKAAGDVQSLGIFGFGAAAHIVAQIAVYRNTEVFAFTSPGDTAAQKFALETGAVWAGSSLERSPKELDAAIIFAPVGPLVPLALSAVRKGGRVVCGGIHMSDIPAMPYALLWGERELVSVANLTRKDAVEFFPLARQAQVRVATHKIRLADTNEAIADLRAGRVNGAVVIVP